MIRDSASQSPFLPAWVYLIPLAAIVLFYEALQPGPRDPSQRMVWFSVLIIIGTAALTRACRVQKQFDLFEPLYMVFGRVLGGSLLYFISLDSDIKAPGEVKAWFFYLLWICVFMQVGALLQLGSWLSTGRRTLWTVLYCILALLSTFFLARYFTVLFLVMTAVTWHYQRNRVRAFQVVALFLLVVAYLGVAGLYREWISPGYNLDEAGDLVQLASQQKELVVHYVVGNLEELYNLSEVISMTPSELPYQFGSTFTPVFLKPIPRVLMPTKPLGASAVFTRQLSPGSYDSGLVTALGAWGEWYLNFSWLGLVLGMALTGALCSAAYQAMKAATEFG